jgi:hypothetical protein
MRRSLTASGFPGGVVQPGTRLRRLDDAGGNSQLASHSNDTPSLRQRARRGRTLNARQPVSEAVLTISPPRCLRYGHEARVRKNSASSWMRHYFDLQRLLNGLIFGPRRAVCRELCDLIFTQFLPQRGH